MSRCNRSPCCWIRASIGVGPLRRRPIPWSAAPAADGHGTQLVLMPLPEPIRDAGRVIRLAAFGRTSLDRQWRLPQIRVEGRFWQEGNISLLIPGPLVAEQIGPLGCEQTGTGPLRPRGRANRRRSNHLGPTPPVEVLLSYRPNAVHMLQHTGR